MLYKLWLFLKRFLVTMISYKTALALGIVGGLVGLVKFSFMGKFLSDGNSFPALEQFGGNLLAYLIIGTAFTSFVGVSLNSFQATIRAEQQMGTLEYLLLSNTRLELILIYSGLMNFLQALVNVAFLLVLVIFVFDIPLDINLPGATAVVILTVLSLSGIGLMSAGIIIITKVGDPINWIFTTLTGLLSGVLFPVEYLPQPLQVVSAMLPTTHALQALRLTLIQKAGLPEIMPQVILLSLMTVITIPLGFAVLRIGFGKARREGSLAQY